MTIISELGKTNFVMTIFHKTSPNQVEGGFKKDFMIHVPFYL